MPEWLTVNVALVAVAVVAVLLRGVGDDKKMILTHLFDFLKGKLVKDHPKAVVSSKTGSMRAQLLELAHRFADQGYDIHMCICPEKSEVSVTLREDDDAKSDT